MRQPDYSGQFKRDVKQALRFERTGRHSDLFDN
jgi:mRNA-degrading endonuclease YafQ of YafQ-DinJ toxin-antitoxin module